MESNYFLVLSFLFSIGLDSGNLCKRKQLVVFALPPALHPVSVIETINITREWILLFSNDFAEKHGPINFH